MPNNPRSIKKGKKGKKHQKESKTGKVNTRSSKKTSRSRLIWAAIVIIAGFSIVGVLQSPITLSRGFLTWNVDSVNGSPAGSNVLTADGLQFTIPGNGITWHGQFALGDLHFDGARDLGWVQNGNTSTALQQFNFHGVLLAYTLMNYASMLPGIVGITDGEIGEQLYYRETNFWGVNGYTYHGYLKANYLSIPSNFVSLLNQQLFLSVGLRIKTDPTLLSVQSFNSTTQQFNYTGAIWSGILNATTGTVPASGLVSAPATIITNEFGGSPSEPTDANVTSGTTTPVSAMSTVSDFIKTKLGPVYPDDPFRVTSARSTLIQVGALEAGPSKGSALTLTGGNWNNNATVNQTYDPGMFADPNRGDVQGYVPLMLRPQTKITQTTWTYDYFYVHSCWLGLDGFSTHDNTVTRPTAVELLNPYIMPTVNFSVLVAANYTVTPLQGTSDPETPIINGTENVFSDAITSKITAVSGTGNSLFGNFLTILIWIAVIAVVFVVLYLVVKWRSGKPGERDLSRPSQSGTTVQYFGSGYEER